MVKRSKNYFSFFGILLATISIKMNSFNSRISTINKVFLYMINTLIHKTQLKPIKLYSTNNHITNQGNKND